MRKNCWLNKLHDKINLWRLNRLEKKIDKLILEKYHKNGAFELKWDNSFTEENLEYIKDKLYKATSVPKIYFENSQEYEKMLNKKLVESLKKDIEEYE